MVRTIQLPVAHERVGEPSAGPLQRVQGLAGVAILTLAATTLGLPLSGGHLATDLLLVILGYKMTTRLRQGQYEDRNIVRFWLGHLGRVGVPMLVALGLTVTYWSWTGAVTAAQQEAVLRAMTLTLNTMDHSTDSNIEAIGHLRLVALISQFALLLPAVLFLCRKVPSKGRAGLLCAVGATAAIGRIAMLSADASAQDAGLLTQVFRADGLVIGAAIALAPLPILRRAIPVRFAPLLFVGLLFCFLVAPGANASGPIIGIAAWTSMSLSIALVASAAGGGLVGALSSFADSDHMRWLGGRILSILIWHPLIGYIFNGDSSGTATSETATDMSSWPGFLVFALRVTFTLAAAATSYRYLALPLASLARQLAVGPRRSEPTPTAEPADPIKATEEPGPTPEDAPWLSRPYPAVSSNHPAVRPLRLSREAHTSPAETR